MEGIKEKRRPFIRVLPVELIPTRYCIYNCFGLQFVV